MNVYAEFIKSIYKYTKHSFAVRAKIRPGEAVFRNKSVNQKA